MSSSRANDWTLGKSIWFLYRPRKGKWAFHSVCYEREAYQHLREIKEANPHTEFKAQNSDGTPYEVKPPLREVS